MVCCSSTGPLEEVHECFVWGNPVPHIFSVIALKRPLCAFGRERRSVPHTKYMFAIQNTPVLPQGGPPTPSNCTADKTGGHTEAARRTTRPRQKRTGPRGARGTSCFRSSAGSPPASSTQNITISESGLILSSSAITSPSQNRHLITLSK